MPHVVALGRTDSELEVAVNLRGTEATLAVEIKDAAGNQITDFGSPATGYVMANGQQEVSNDETVIVAANASGKGATLTNHSTTVAVYLGTTGVTTGNGFYLGPGESVPVFTVSAIVGITAGDTAVIGFMSFT